MAEKMDDDMSSLATKETVEIEPEKTSDNNVDSCAVSMKAVSGEIIKIDLRQKMLSRLSKSDAHFKHQQRGEPDLTSSEKYNIAEAILNKNEVTFLSRFGKYLIEEDLSYFEDSKEEYEIKFYLAQISERLNSSKNQLNVKNRRYEAMKKLVEAGEYFSDEEMKWREPYLYEQMIGQYLTHEERQTEIDKSDLRFSTILLKHISQQQENFVYQLQKDYEEGQEEEEEDDSDSEEAAEQGAHPDENENTERAPTIPEDEKQLLREEFLHIMQERFISGRDKDFDYSGVDGNAEYDSLAIRAQDEEERYFDGDDSDSMDIGGMG